MKSSARLNPRHQDLVRTKIQASVILNRLTKCVQGKIEMSAVQVAAARILLDKSVPSLQSTEVSGKGGGPVVLVTAAAHDADL